jgi:hypothetical protein
LPTSEEPNERVAEPLTVFAKELVFVRENIFTVRFATKSIVSSAFAVKFVLVEDLDDCPYQLVPHDVDAVRVSIILVVYDDLMWLIVLMLISHLKLPCSGPPGFVCNADMLQRSRSATPT